MGNFIGTPKKIRISYFLSEAILTDIKGNMALHGYDLKGKSKWIMEAVLQLFSFENYHELVMINHEMSGFEKLDSISVDQAFKTKLDEAVIEIRKRFPSIEGVQSKILRTAIMQRLLR
jgi:hypothetical protein